MVLKYFSFRQVKSNNLSLFASLPRLRSFNPITNPSEKSYKQNKTNNFEIMQNFCQKLYLQKCLEALKGLFLPDDVQ